MKKPVLVLGSAVAVVILILMVSAWVRHARLRGIQTDVRPGMSREQVEDLLGGPPDDSREIEYWRPGKRAGSRVQAKGVSAEWTVGGRTVVITFDDQDKVHWFSMKRP
jgi:hypothetical protein